MILCDSSLLAQLPQFIQEPNYDLVNPASVDIRIGTRLLLEVDDRKYKGIDLTDFSESFPFLFPPGAFALVSTYEWLMVPNGYAVELKLKSSRAREGWNHSLAFWFDPGWSGIGTMEVSNVTRYTSLPIWYGMRFGQIIVHQLDQHAARPYSGRYQFATDVEGSKA